jgi:hypothetical protein
MDTAEHKSRDCLRKEVQAAGLQAVRLGRIRLDDLGDVVGLPLSNIRRKSQQPLSLPPPPLFPLTPLNFGLDSITKKIRALFIGIKNGINPRQRSCPKTGHRRFRVDLLTAHPIFPCLHRNRLSLADSVGWPQWPQFPK